MPVASTPGPHAALNKNKSHRPNVEFVSIFLGKGCMPLIIVSKETMTQEKPLWGESCWAYVPELPAETHTILNAQAFNRKSINYFLLYSNYFGYRWGISHSVFPGELYHLQRRWQITDRLFVPEPRIYSSLFPSMPCFPMNTLAFLIYLFLCF